MIWNYPKYSWKDMRFLLFLWMTPEMRARARLVYSFELWQDITGWDDEMLAQTLGKCRKNLDKKEKCWMGDQVSYWLRLCGRAYRKLLRRHTDRCTMSTQFMPGIFSLNSNILTVPSSTFKTRTRIVFFQSCASR